jgi:translation initiation factor IF-1
MFPRGTRVKISGKWVGVVDNIAKTSHGYVYSVKLDDGRTVEAHESVVEEEGSRMKVGDKVRVKGHIPVDGGKTGTLKYEDEYYKHAWVVDVDGEDTPATFYESELELVTQGEYDLTGKRVRITRGYFINNVGPIVGEDENGNLLVDLRFEKPIPFSKKDVELLPDEQGVNPDTWTEKVISGMRNELERQVFDTLGVKVQPSIKKGDRAKVLITSKKWEVGTVQSVAETTIQGLKYKVLLDSGKTVWRYADSVKRLIDEPIELPLSEVIAAAEGDTAPAKDHVVFT